MYKKVFLDPTYGDLRKLFEWWFLIYDLIFSPHYSNYLPETKLKNS